MNLTLFKIKMKAKAVGVILLLLLFFTSFSLTAQNQNPDVDVYLQQLVETQKLNLKDVLEWKITNQHTSRLSNVEHIYFQQMYNGIGVNGANSSIHILPNGRILTKDNHFVKNLENKINGPKTAKISTIKAIEAVSQQLNITISKQIKALEVKGIT